MDYLNINKQAWDKRTSLHVKSDFYDVERFLSGKSSLNPIEMELVGSVKGKDLLHLQCHFGQDTLSWAKMGANVTGVDLSHNAIKEAKILANKMKLDATFIESDVYEFAQSNNNKFDIVFTSYGVLCWLPDLSKWANTIASSLKSGGELILVEFHSFSDLLSGYSYFAQDLPDIESEGTYTENCDGVESTVVTWPHPISNVITALINVGLSIEVFREFPYSPYNCMEGLEEVESKGFQLTHKGQLVPLVYAIKAKLN